MSGNRRSIRLKDYDYTQQGAYYVTVCVLNHARRGTACRAPTTEQFGNPVSGSLSTIIRSFKSAVTREINTIRNIPGLRLWQRNFYEHVIRDMSSLASIREYVINNPVNWEKDEYYS